MTRIKVNEAILRWAIERSNLTFEFLQKRFPKIQSWRTGENLPTLRQLETLAKVTSTPLGYFFLTEPPEERLPIPHFRTIHDEPERGPSVDLLETVQTMQRRQAWMREYLIKEGKEPLRFVRSESHDKDYYYIADIIRRTLGFEEGWAEQQATWENALRVLREALETIGILVVVNGITGNNTQRKLNPTEFRGFVLIDDYAPLVFVNGADGKAAQMFTLAHELAHVWFGSSAAFDLREMQPANDPIEQACNKVAAEFLVPESKLRKIWLSVHQFSEPFQVIARQFKVSVLVAARRALDLQLIKKTEFFDFYREYQEDELRKTAQKTKGGDYYANQNLRIGQRFARTVMQATKEGQLLYREAYQLTGLRGKTFKRFSETLGLGWSL